MATWGQINVGIGTTVLCRGTRTTGIDGIGRYTQELLARLSANSALKTIPFSFGTGGMLPNGLEPHRLPRFSLGTLPSLLLGRSYLGSQQLLDRVDLIHATDHLIPRCKSVPVLATIMDAIPLAHPEWVNSRLRFIKNVIWRKSAGFADHVITISEHSKKELIEYFGLPEQRISVTPLGVDSRWFVQPTRHQLLDLRSRYNLPEKFFLFVGTLQIRKNVARLIDAHCALPPSIRKSHPLLIIGREGRQCSDIVDRLHKDRADSSIRWLKYVPNADLPGILHCACGLVFPSLHEGFGLPVLEAFAAGLPVITSNVTSLPEVAGDAAMLVDPYDCENITWAMQKLIEDTTLAGNLQRAGLRRAKEFTWDRTAQATIEIYHNLCSRS